MGLQVADGAVDRCRAARHDMVRQRLRRAIDECGRATWTRRKSTRFLGRMGPAGGQNNGDGRAESATASVAHEV